MHIKDFRGSSGTLLSILTVFGVACMIFNYGFLVVTAFVLHWYTPIILFALGLAGNFVFPFLLRIAAPQMHDATVSLIGFIVLPISAWMMIAGILP